VNPATAAPVTVVTDVVVLSIETVEVLVVDWVNVSVVVIVSVKVKLHQSEISERSSLIGNGVGLWASKPNSPSKSLIRGRERGRNPGLL
jgi:hypothetical protein